MNKFLLLSLTIISAVLTSCNSAEPLSPAAEQATVAVLAQTLVAEKLTALPTLTQTFTPQPPTQTFTPVPSATFTQTHTPTITVTASQTSTSTPSGYIDPNLLLNYYFTLAETGPIGCGDYIFPVHIGIYKTDDPAQNVRTALEILFAQQGGTVAGLANPIGPSNIRIDQVTFFPSRGHIEVDTFGTVVKDNKDYCQWARIHAQVNTTALSAAKPYTVNITLNGKPFNDFASKDH